MTIQEQFEAFHKQHPEAYAYLLVLVNKVRALGYSRYGIAPLWEQLRWHFNIEHNEEFKLNNNYRSRYARLIIKQHPELDGFFELRECKAA